MYKKYRTSIYFVLGCLTGIGLTLFGPYVRKQLLSNPETKFNTFHSSRASFSFQHPNDFPITPLSDQSIYQFADENYIEWINLGTLDFTPNAPSMGEGFLIVKRIPCMITGTYEELILQEYKDLIAGWKRIDNRADTTLPIIVKTKLGNKDAYKITNNNPDTTGTFDNTSYEIDTFSPCLRYRLYITPRDKERTKQMEEILKTFKFE